VTFFIQFLTRKRLTVLSTSKNEWLRIRRLRLKKILCLYLSCNRNIQGLTQGAPWECPFPLGSVLSLPPKQDIEREMLRAQALISMIAEMVTLSMSMSHGLSSLDMHSNRVAATSRKLCPREQA
jgi:hypothetical protein